MYSGLIHGWGYIRVGLYLECFERYGGLVHRVAYFRGRGTYSRKFTVSEIKRDEVRPLSHTITGGSARGKKCRQKHARNDAILARNTRINSTKVLCLSFIFVLFGSRLSMSFDDSTSDSTITPRHFVFALGRDEAFIQRFCA